METFFKGIGTKMGKKQEIMCFICKRKIEDINKAEMIRGPDGTKVVCHIHHHGVKAEINDEYEE